ncbi:hypothetical protein Pelo_7787 [Pelomyxa schiedti]|nr:hypothetical protein Pelo_7787 [Pelomyxa schiedti]
MHSQSPAASAPSPSSSAIASPNDVATSASDNTNRENTRKYTTTERAVAFLAGWHERAGARSVMMSPNLCVPLSVARIVVEFLLGSICVYRRGTWKTIGDGIKVVDDTTQWIAIENRSCGSSVGGRIAWLEPSLQELAGARDRVYWAFDVVKYTPGACQEGLGASTTLMGMVLDSASSAGGDYYPITYSSLSNRGVNSFGLSFSGSLITTRVQGNMVYDRRVTNPTRVLETEQFSFLLTFESPDKKRGHVDVFRNMNLLVSYDNVDTSLPLYPTVNMCCRPSYYKFVMDPTLPDGL